ncbi:acetate--CoA ligase [Pigmentiphaga soli]|uniref:Acetate--CoA ligase n=1 Tax=Pigmentiphaga soli TaxID=1007095 RepID=A0ABP8HNS4_9BURK
MSQHYLDPVINPRTVAVIGASKSPLKRGNRAIRTLASANYKGTILPIHPSDDEILGYKAYPSVAAVPFDIDLALVCTAAATVPDILEECGRKGVKGAVLLAGGFSEASEEGRVLEERAVAVAKRYGVRLIGPNTSGMFSARMGCNASGWFNVPTGPLALLSNSANVLLSLVAEFQFQANTGISTMLSVGNQADIQFHEYLDYLGTDDATRAALFYVEGFKNGPAFIETARKVAPAKPIVMYVAGRSDAGKGAAKSHSGSLAGDYAVSRGVLQQAGVVMVGQSDHMYPVADALSLFPVMKGRRVAVVSEGGGPITMAAEALAANGLVLAQLSAETQAKIHAVVPAASAISNPVDAGGGTDPRVEYYGPISKAILEDPNIDALLLVGYFGGYTTRYDDSVAEAEQAVCRELGELMHKHGKPVIVQTHFANFKPSSLAVLREAGVPFHRHIEVAVQCLAAAADYGRARERLLASAGADQALAPRAHAEALIQAARKQGRDLLETESREILGEYGIQVPPSVLMRTDGDAAAAIGKLGAAPLAVKIVSKDILHKSEAGGVKLNVTGEQALRAAFAEIKANAARYDAGAEVTGALATPMAARGVELIIGVTQDPQYGKVIMFGLGGIFVEVIRDVAFRSLPLKEADAREMIAELRYASVLDGVRGAAAADKEALVDLLMKVSQVATAHPDLAEIDLNPVILHDKGYSVVDARMIVAPAS